VTLLFYSFAFTINVWHRKFITTDVTAVRVNNQHGIQRLGQDFDKNTQIHSAYTITCVEELQIGALKMQFVCIIFSISPEYLQQNLNF